MMKLITIMGLLLVSLTTFADAGLNYLPKGTKVIFSKQLNWDSQGYIHFAFISPSKYCALKKESKAQDITLNHEYEISDLIPQTGGILMTLQGAFNKDEAGGELLDDVRHIYRGARNLYPRPPVYLPSENSLYIECGGSDVYDLGIDQIGLKLNEIGAQFVFPN